MSIEFASGTSADETAPLRRAYGELRATLDDADGIRERMVAALADRDAALDRLATMCERVVRHLDTPIMVVDGGLRVRVASQPAEKALGAGDTAGRDLRELMPPRLVGAVRRCLHPIGDEAGGATPDDEAGHRAGERPVAGAGTGRVVEASEVTPAGPLRVSVERVCSEGPAQAWTRFLPDRRALTARELAPRYGLVHLAQEEPEA